MKFKKLCVDRVLVRQMTKNQMVTLTTLQNSSVEMGQPFKRTTIFAVLLQAFIVERPDGSYFSTKYTTACLEFAKRHLEDFQTMRIQIVWSAQTKIDLFGLNAKQHVWRKPSTAHHVANTISTGNHGGNRDAFQLQELGDLSG